MINDTKGVQNTNDLMCESVFGAFTYIFNMIPNVAVESVSGIVAARRNGFMAREVTSSGRGATGVSAEASVRPALFHSLDPRLRRALMIMAMRVRKRVHKQAVEDRAAHDEYYKQKRELVRAKELEALAQMSLNAIDSHEMFGPRGIKSVVELNSILKNDKFKGNAKQITELLKEQIKIRVIGFGWTQFPLAWSSAADHTIGTVPDLLARFKAILKYELKHGTPDVPNTPRLTPRCVKQLGTPTEQRITFESELQVSEEENEKLIIAARQKRDETDGCSTAHLQPHVAPVLKVGMKIEVLLGYFEDQKKCMSWFAGAIQRISDGSDAFKKGGRMKGNHACGFCLVRWDSWKTGDAEFEADEYEETWQAIKVSLFNKERSSGWRVYLE
jgi:hypothetical protein